MEIGVERTIHEPHMDLILDDIKLLLIPFWRNFTKILRNFSFAKGNDTFILEVRAKWNFDKSFICSNIKNEVIVIKLSFQELIAALVIEQRCILRIGSRWNILAILKIVQSNDNSFVVVCKIWRFYFDREKLFLILI
jgi:hypothetical protein